VKYDQIEEGVRPRNTPANVEPARKRKVVDFDKRGHKFEIEQYVPVSASDLDYHPTLAPSYENGSDQALEPGCAVRKFGDLLQPAESPDEVFGVTRSRVEPGDTAQVATAGVVRAKAGSPIKASDHVAPGEGGTFHLVKAGSFVGIAMSSVSDADLQTTRGRLDETRGRADETFFQMRMVRGTKKKNAARGDLSGQYLALSGLRLGGMRVEAGATVSLDHANATILLRSNAVARIS
jgi:hypothetical protein